MGLKDRRGGADRKCPPRAIQNAGWEIYILPFELKGEWSPWNEVVSCLMSKIKLDPSSSGKDRFSSVIYDCNKGKSAMQTEFSTLIGTEVTGHREGKWRNKEGSQQSLSRVKEVKNYKKQEDGDMVPVNPIWICQLVLIRHGLSVSHTGWETGTLFQMLVRTSSKSFWQLWVSLSRYFKRSWVLLGIES